jgi:hypothetical protein
MFIGKIFIALLLTSILSMPAFPNTSLSKPDQVTVKAALDIQVA